MAPELRRQANSSAPVEIVAYIPTHSSYTRYRSYRKVNPLFSPPIQQNLAGFFKKRQFHIEITISIMPLFCKSKPRR